MYLVRKGVYSLQSGTKIFNSNAYRGDFTAEELIIIEYIIKFETADTITEKTQIFKRVKYRKMLEELPILKFNKITLGRKLKKLSDEQILVRKIIKDDDGTRVYYAEGSKIKKIKS